MPEDYAGPLAEKLNAGVDAQASPWQWAAGLAQFLPGALSGAREAVVPELQSWQGALGTALGAMPAGRMLAPPRLGYGPRDFRPPNPGHPESPAATSGEVAAMSRPIGALRFDPMEVGNFGRQPQMTQQATAGNRVADFTKQLLDAGTNRGAFDSVFAAAKAARLSKKELSEVAAGYSGGVVQPRMSIAELEKDIAKSWLRNARFQNKIAP